MGDSTSDLQSLTARIEKLERQNRHFKPGGLALLLLPLILIVMGQARPSRTLEADSFILRDSSGIKRAELAMLAVGPVLRFFDTNGKARALLSEIGYVIVGTGTRTLPTDKGPVEVPINRINLGLHGLDFSDEHGKTVIQLGGLANPKSPSLSPSLRLFDSNEKSRVELSGRSDFGPGIYLNDEAEKSRVSLGLTNEGPFIIANDSEGFSVELGSTDLVTSRTGEQHRTSAASLVLFGKDGKVLWSAP